jgi:16S rRNA (guanine1207-N2)-methyltransferase
VIDTRLRLALVEGGLRLPDDGLIAVIKPPVTAELSACDPARLRVIDGFKPSVDHWSARGFTCSVEPEESYAAVILCLPRAKSEARALVAEAMQMSAGPVVIDGQKTDGVDSILRDMRARTKISGPISKAHGKLFWCAAADPDAFVDWRSKPSLTPGGFWTAPGVFSADAVDPASDLLARSLPADLGRLVADLGAGWGYLAAHVLTRDTVEVVHLVEAEHMALECARRNVTDPRAVFHWADARHWSPPQPLDGVVMNPPFHTGRAADSSLGQAFITSAASVLSPQGHLWMVCNRHLPYEATLEDHFSRVAEIGGDASFKLFHAHKPLRRARRQT